MAHDMETRYRAVDAVRNGATLAEAAGRVGASTESVRRWCAAEGISFRRGPRGGAIVAARRKRGPGEKPARLELDQRLCIHTELKLERTQAQIARGIGFSPATVSREISRNGGKEAYDPYAAQLRADREAARPKDRKVDSDRRLREHVLARLAQRWSPEQISAELSREYPGEEG